MSKQYSDVCCFLGGGEHAQQPKFGEKKFIRHFGRFNFSRLSLAFILKYYAISVACGETIRIASKNSVKLGEKSNSDF